jgi:hypothetical protein
MSIFAISRDGAMNSLARSSHPGQQIVGWQTVEVITLDDFVRQLRIERVAFIKIDGEGAGKLVLEGARSLLYSANPPTILCEFCDLTASGFQSSGRDLWDAFVSYGYELFSLSGTSPCTIHPAQRKDKYIYENLVARKTSQ